MLARAAVAAGAKAGRLVLATAGAVNGRLGSYGRSGSYDGVRVRHRGHFIGIWQDVTGRKETSRVKSSM